MNLKTIPKYPLPPPSQNKNKTKQNKQQNCTPINVLFEKNINITV